MPIQCVGGCFFFLLQERNKPKDPPRKPKSAPFFLPTVAGLEPKFELPEEDKEDKKVNFLELSIANEKKTFFQLLMTSYVLLIILKVTEYLLQPQILCLENCL